ncbi:MAG: hypothetical protein GOVbin8609_54 [Prokaryotic dsDNA virus sp.]|nr:MAG: hypothetical protein GOVbin8609_54 [Prokaryotic dsDNA virus sp.]
MVIETLKSKGFHINVYEQKATIYKHGDYIMSLTRYSKNNSWKFNSSPISESRIIMIANRIAYNWKVKRIYLR